jgi:hypothetical protein
MSWIAAAVAGSAIIGGASSFIGSKKAADASKDANAASVGEQRRQYDTTREDFRPYREVGTGALGALADIYGIARPAAPGSPDASPLAKYSRIAAPAEWLKLGKTDADWDKYVGDYLGAGYAVTQGPKGINQNMRTYIDRQITRQDNTGVGQGAGFYTGGARPGGATQGGAYIGGGDSIGDVGFSSGGGTGQPVDRTGGFYESPGYRFRLSEGQKAIERSAAARGRLFSGGALKATENYAQGVASDEWGRWLSGLQSLAGVGQSATGSTAAAGANAANVISQSNMSSGAQRASSYLAGAEGINNSIQGGLGNWVYYNARN